MGNIIKLSDYGTLYSEENYILTYFKKAFSFEYIKESQDLIIESVLKERNSIYFYESMMLDGNKRRNFAVDVLVPLDKYRLSAENFSKQSYIKIVNYTNATVKTDTTFDVTMRFASLGIDYTITLDKSEVAVVYNDFCDCYSDKMKVKTKHIGSMSDGVYIIEFFDKGEGAFFYDTEKDAKVSYFRFINDKIENIELSNFLRLKKFTNDIVSLNGNPTLLKYNYDIESREIKIEYDAFGIIQKTSDNLSIHEIYYKENKYDDDYEPVDYIIACHPLYLDPFEFRNTYNTKKWIIESIDFEDNEFVYYKRHIYTIDDEEGLINAINNYEYDSDIISF